MIKDVILVFFLAMVGVLVVRNYKAVWTLEQGIAGTGLDAGALISGASRPYITTSGAAGL